MMNLNSLAWPSKIAEERLISDVFFNVKKLFLSIIFIGKIIKQTSHKTECSKNFF